MKIMTPFPRLVVDGEAVRYNAEQVVARCASEGILVAGVTKGLCAREPVVRAMVDGGCPELADSRVANLAALRIMGFGRPLLLLRIPMVSELPWVLDVADCSLVSMAETVRAMERQCAAAKRTHEVIVMIDLGDLREGLWPDRTERMCEALVSCPRVRCRGVGANFGCFGGVLPTKKKLGELLSVARAMEQVLGYPLKTVSGGATSSLDLLDRGEIPRGVNHLRIGEGILLGTDVTSSRVIPWLRQQTMYLEAEVVEVRRKPSVPVGDVGRDAFGGSPTFEDKGERLRAIVAVGRQDVRIEGLRPERNGVTVLGGSSDHLLLDVEEAVPSVSLGETLRFFPDYGAMLALSTSPYVGFEMV